MSDSELRRDEFISILEQFRISVYSLRVFNDQIGAAAEEHDKSSMLSLANSLKSIGSIILNKEEAIEIQRDIKSANQSKADRMRRVVDITFSLRKSAPLQASLLRSSTLISLISTLEGLIADLNHEYYKIFPQAFPADNYSITLSDLREYGSVEEVEKYLISKEVESVLMQSISKQLERFAVKSKVDLKPIATYLDRVTEIAQRRNVLVHNKGIVNHQYIKHVNQDLIKQYELSIGDSLTPNNEYLLDSINLTEIVGTTLLIQCWRQWDKENIETAEALINQFIFECLIDEHYNQALCLSSVSRSITFSDKDTELAIAINRGIALHRLGLNDQLTTLLDSIDWTKSSIKFQIAVCVLRSQESEFRSLLPKSVELGEITRHSIETWPLFRDFRSSDDYLQILNELFPENES
jgi:hypothetical protein